MLNIATYLPDSRPREVWLDIRGLGKDAGGLLETVDIRAFSVILASPEQLPLRNQPSGVRLAVPAAMAGAEDRAAEPKADVQVFHDVKHLAQRNGGPSARALFGTVASENDLHRFADDLKASGAEYGIVELKDETNIPLELLIAWFQNVPTKILKYVSSSEEGDIALRTLHHGADGLLLKTQNAEELKQAAHLVSVESATKLELTEWTVTRATYIGWGHRALVDTVSLLTQSEGMLIGSTCNAFAMMCSETHYLPYMPLRPFRVNAGAVHSYLMCPSNRTHYLADLEMGHEVMVVDSSGNGRAVRVGRVKIERRPLISLDFTDGKVTGNAIVQADWHVRIMDSKGAPLHVTHCKPGTKLLGWQSTAARHCGNAIDELLIER